MILNYIINKLTRFLKASFLFFYIKNTGKALSIGLPEINDYYFDKDFALP